MDDVAETVETEEPTSPDTPTDVSEPGPTPASEAEPDAGEPTSPDAQAAPPDANADPPEWLKLAEQYKGDKGLIAKAYSEKVRYASQLSKENEQLKAQVQQMRSRPPQPPPPPPATKDLERIDARIKAFESRTENTTKERDDALKTWNALDRQIAVAEDRLARADEVDKPQLTLELATLKHQKNQAAYTYNHANERLESYNDEKERLANERQSAERRIEDEKARQEQDAAEDAEFRQTFPKSFDEHFDRTWSEAKLPQDQKVNDHGWRVVNALMCVDLWRLGQQGQKMDPAALGPAVKGYVDEYAAMMGFAKTLDFNQTSTAKANVATPLLGTPKPRPAVPPVPSASKGESADWRQSPALVRARQGMQKLGLG